MANLDLIMLFLPIVFMVHEYEEVIMFRCWFGCNRNELKKRFPKFEYFLAHRGYFDYSTATFAVGTAHEFLLISAITFCSMWLDAYQWWFAAFAGYSIHLIVHLAQWAIYRKYIPAIITTILTLPYCVYAFVIFAKTSILSPSQMLLWAVVGVTLAILSLLSAFFLMNRFQKWLNKHKCKCKEL